MAGWILVVDGDASNAAMLVDGLRESGWDASAAGNLPEAIDRMRNGRYSLVVSDVRMDDDEGLRLLEAVREGVRPVVPVILMGSYGTETAVERGLAAGAFASLTKPFPLDALLALVTRAHGAPRAQD